MGASLESLSRCKGFAKSICVATAQFKAVRKILNRRRAVILDPPAVVELT